MFSAPHSNINFCFTTLVPSAFHSYWSRVFQSRVFSRPDASGDVFVLRCRARHVAAQIAELARGLEMRVASRNCRVSWVVRRVRLMESFGLLDAHREPKPLGRNGQTAPGCQPVYVPRERSRPQTADR